MPGSPILSTGAHAEPEKWRAGDRSWRAERPFGEYSDVSVSLLSARQSRPKLLRHILDKSTGRNANCDTFRP